MSASATLPTDDVFIIAEIGINHNGDLKIAKQLIDMAQQAGCNAVKFQKRTIDEVYTPEYLAGTRESPWGTTQRDQKEGLEFGKSEFDEIDRYCKKKGIEWFASAWDLKSQDFLSQYPCRFNKVASAMATYWPLVEKIAEEGKLTFISTGMCTDAEVEQLVNVFRTKRCPFVLMHCVSTYPSNDEDLNLSVIRSFQEKFECPVGYSGHEKGVVTSVVATALGAVAVERHITLDRTMYGSDQAASLEKRGLELLVRDCRDIKKALGSGVRKILDEEKAVAKKLRWFAPEAQA